MMVIYASNQFTQIIVAYTSSTRCRWNGTT